MRTFEQLRWDRRSNALNVSLGVALLLQVVVAWANAEDCVSSPDNTFTVKPNIYASDVGYFTFEECGDTLSPSLLLEIGETYTFVQHDRSNYFRPLGFLYSESGAIDGQHKVMSPNVTWNEATSCQSSSTCTAPMYFENDEYLGQYSNIPDIVTDNIFDADIGVAHYDFMFWTRIHIWAENNYTVKIRFSEDDVGSPIYYYSRHHKAIGGQIKLTKGGVVVNDSVTSMLPAGYKERSAFDVRCGTYGLADYQLPNPVCQDRFVCGAEQGDQVLQDFASCIEAMNCFMMSGMTTGVKAQSEMALFIHQMIPHHENAINMAKALLKTGTIDCPDLAIDTGDCRLEGILYTIINSQLFQINIMYRYLAEKGLPEQDNCVVEIETLMIDGELVSSGSSEKGLQTLSSHSWMSAAAVLGAGYPFF